MLACVSVLAVLTTGCSLAETIEFFVSSSPSETIETEPEPERKTPEEEVAGTTTTSIPDEPIQTERDLADFQGFDSFHPERGTLTVEIRLDPETRSHDSIIWHTNDSRFVLMVDSYRSASLNTNVTRILARAGGNQRFVDSAYAGGNFPEASIIVNNDQSLTEYEQKDGWYRPRLVPLGEWHKVTMTWEGFPTGTVTIYLDGEEVASKEYDSRYDDDRGLASSYVTSGVPRDWSPQTWKTVGGTTTFLTPLEETMDAGSGVEYRNLQLYNSVLSPDELLGAD